MHNESSEDVANQKSKNIWLELWFWWQVLVCVCVFVCLYVYCCYLWRVFYVCSLSCQWDLHINKKRTSKRELQTRIRIKYFSSRIIFSFSLNSRCRLTFVWNFHRKFSILPPVSCKAIRLQPDYTLNAAPLSPHTPSTYTNMRVCVCVCEIFKFINYAILWFWGVECAKILFYTRLCPRHENAQFIFLPACHAHSSKQREASGLHFNIIYMNLGCRKCCPHRAHPGRGTKVQTWPQPQTWPELSLSELWICRCLSRECEHVLSSVSVWVCTCVCVSRCVELMI